MSVLFFPFVVLVLVDLAFSSLMRLFHCSRVEKFRAMERSMCTRMFPNAKKGLPDPLPKKAAGTIASVVCSHL